MPPRTPQARRSRAETQAENRQRLLDAAWVLFRERGFGAATLDEIAAQAGLTIGAVYSNFRGKADLFLAMLDGLDISPADLTAAEGDFETLADRFEALGRSLFLQTEAEREDAALQMELYAYAIRNDEARRSLTTSFASAMQPIADALDPVLREAGARCTGQQLVALVQASVDGLLARRGLDPDLVDEGLYATSFRAIGALLDTEITPPRAGP